MSDSLVSTLVDTNSTTRAVNELSLGELGLSMLAYLKISRARARVELFAELKI
jgi:hypothetical protein